jgi:hypothetical protein
MDVNYVLGLSPSQQTIPNNFVLNINSCSIKGEPPPRVITKFKKQTISHLPLCEHIWAQYLKSDCCLLNNGLNDIECPSAFVALFPRNVSPMRPRIFQPAMHFSCDNEIRLTMLKSDCFGYTHLDLSLRAKPPHGLRQALVEGSKIYFDLAHQQSKPDTAWIHLQNFGCNATWFVSWQSTGLSLWCTWQLHLMTLEYESVMAALKPIFCVTVCILYNILCRRDRRESKSGTSRNSGLDIQMNTSEAEPHWTLVILVSSWTLHKTS